MFLLRKGTPHQPPVITIFNICRWWQEQPILKIYIISYLCNYYSRKKEKFEEERNYIQIFIQEISSNFCPPPLGLFIILPLRLGSQGSEISINSGFTASHLSIYDKLQTPGSDLIIYSQNILSFKKFF